MKKAALIVTASLVLLYVVGIVATQNLETEIDIEASPETVWGHLTDFEQYPVWNPFITEISGEAVVGEVISATIESPGQDPMTFSPTILVAEPSSELRWLGRLGIPGLFDGEHYWIIETNQDGSTRLVHGEDFNGILSLLMFWSIRESTEQGFLAMNVALKDRSETEAEETN